MDASTAISTTPDRKADQPFLMPVNVRTCHHYWHVASTVALPAVERGTIKMNEKSRSLA